MIEDYRTKGYDIRVLVGETLTRAELESTLQTVNLFNPELIVIDNLLSRLKSKEKSACLELLTSVTIYKPLILWDKRELTPGTIKPLLGLGKVQIFKESSSLFPFVDSIKPGNAERSLSLFHAALKNNDIFLMFGMIVRRITDLIIAVDDPTLLAGSPWGIKQVISQSKSWDLPSLLSLHTQLLDIDLSIKSGKTKLDLVSHLDLLLIQL